MVTSKTIPMQVDGEACKLTPSIITLSLLNKAPMLVKRKRGRLAPTQTALDNLKISVNKISMADYEQHHYDKDLLIQAGKGHNDELDGICGSDSAVVKMIVAN